MGVVRWRLRCEWRIYINGACVEGNGYDHAESSSDCSDSMGTSFDVPKPGIYTATVTTYQASGHQYGDSIPFTIQ